MMSCDELPFSLIGIYCAFCVWQHGNVSIITFFFFFLPPLLLIHKAIWYFPTSHSCSFFFLSPRFCASFLILSMATPSGSLIFCYILSQLLFFPCRIFYALYIHVCRRHKSLIPGLGRSPGVRSGSPLQSSCLGNPVGRGAWGTTVHGVAESDITEHMHIHTYPCMNW